MVYGALGATAQPLLGALNRGLTSGEWHAPQSQAPAGVHTSCCLCLLTSCCLTAGCTGFQQPSGPSEAELDAAVQRLSARSADWSALSCKERARLIRQCVAASKQVRVQYRTVQPMHESQLASAATCVQAVTAGAQQAAAAKGQYRTGAGEELVGLVPCVWGAREFAETLEANGQPGGSSVRTLSNGQQVVSVFPRGYEPSHAGLQCRQAAHVPALMRRIEGLFFGGMKGELWIEPGQPASQARSCRIFALSAAGLTPRASSEEQKLA